MRRTKEDAAETARQILQAAEVLFLDNGYENVSLEEIAVAAGVTRGAVHWHFKNKQGLLLSLRNQAKLPFQELANEVAESSGGASLKRLDDVISQMLEKIESDPRQKGLIRCMIRLDIALAENGMDCGKAFRREMNDIFVQIFDSVERDLGLPAPWTPQSAASALSATINGIFMSWALDIGLIRLAPDGQQFIKTVLSMWKK